MQPSGRGARLCKSDWFSLPWATGTEPKIVDQFHAIARSGLLASGQPENSKFDVDLLV